MRRIGLWLVLGYTLAVVVPATLWVTDWLELQSKWVQLGYMVSTGVIGGILYAIPYVVHLIRTRGTRRQAK